jgi:hypothetical protein
VIGKYVKDVLTNPRWDMEVEPACDFSKADGTREKVGNRVKTASRKGIALGLACQ